ncbi:MAG: DNA methyltransferase [Chloroflexi bacterium]|nr:DNA methyltransferase [Chloroflexota bacterium]
MAKVILVRCHYLGSLPGGTKLAFGVFVGQQLMGAVTFGVGPYLVYQLVEGTTPDDVVCLTRLWLSDALPRNSESYVLGVITRALRRHTSLKFLVAYSDPGAGHVGAIYQAANWLYTGLSSATPLYDIGDGIARHSRSLAHHYGSHSIRHFAEHGVGVKLVPQSAKHRYLYILDRALRSRLTVPVLRYPRREVIDEGY